MSRIGETPLALLTAWLPPNASPERPQMQLATVDAAGRPDARTVLLSSWDVEGFTFHTDTASRKVAELATNPAVALVVLWPGFTRQLTVAGTAEPLDRAALDSAYARRSPYLQQLAWLNTVELAQRPRSERVAAWAAFTAEHPDPQPSPTWTGYLVRPDRLTFWQSDAEAPSHRLEYRLEADSTWSEHHLAG